MEGCCCISSPLGLCMLLQDQPPRWGLYFGLQCFAHARCCRAGNSATVISVFNIESICAHAMLRFVEYNLSSLPLDPKPCGCHAHRRMTSISRGNGERLVWASHTDTAFRGLLCNLPFSHHAMISWPCCALQGKFGYRICAYGTSSVSCNEPMRYLS